LLGEKEFYSKFYIGIDSGIVLQGLKILCPGKVHFSDIIFVAGDMSAGITFNLID